MYRTIIERQRLFFSSGKTLPVSFRREQLVKLQKAIRAYTPQIEEALFQDFRKPSAEAFLSEIAMSLRSIEHSLKNLKKWSRAKRVRSSLLNFPSKEYIIPEPLGISLLISPWNYPFLLAIDPLVASISAGNCSILKPSEYSPHTATVLQEIITTIFNPEYITLIEGDAETSRELLNNKFDKIFFTGSTQVGKIVYEAAAKHLTPVTLELGGKSPCIVTESAVLPIAAKRIIWGKMLNAGQTCVAPDYVLVHKDVLQQLVEQFKIAIRQIYGTDIKNNPDFPRIINEKHYSRLHTYLASAQTLFGGEMDADELFISPTLIENCSWDDPIMKEEIFGPILPILTYSSFDEVITQINSLEKPLALYLFTKNKEEIRQIETHCHFGGGCINDTLSQLLNHHLSFGGVGHSGTGSYHGKAGFDCFSHFKSMVSRSTCIDIPFRYAPYKMNKINFLRRFFG